MKKKKNIIIISLILLVVIIIGVIIVIFTNKREKNSYSEITLDGYQFTINDKYQYEYLEEEKIGVFNNDMFLSSYVYISDKDYSSLISSSSYYTNMGAKELDSNIEETKFGNYDGFVNVKKVNYLDINKEYNLVIILIKIKSDKTFVLQYEVSSEENTEEILKDIKNGLLNIKKVK